MEKLITVDFRGGELYAVRRPEGIFVALKPACEALGIAWRGQLRRVRRDEILREGVIIATVPSDGGAQDTVCLRVDLAHGWLLSISTGRIRDAVARKRVAACRQEVSSALQKLHGATRESQTLTIEERLKLVAEARKAFDVPVAQRLWIELGLPSVPEMAAAGGPQHTPGRLGIFRVIDGGAAG